MSKETPLHNQRLAAVLGIVSKEPPNFSEDDGAAKLLLVHFSSRINDTGTFHEFMAQLWAARYAVGLRVAREQVADAKALELARELAQASAAEITLAACCTWGIPTD